MGERMVFEVDIYTLNKADNPVFYIGRTSNIVKRMSDHRKTYGEDICLGIIDTIKVFNLEDSILVEQLYITHYLNKGFELDNVVTYTPSILVRGLDTDTAFCHALKATTALIQSNKIPEDTLEFYRMYTNRLTLHIGSRIVADKWIATHHGYYCHKEIKPQQIS